jgi:hypothetical protein
MPNVIQDVYDVDNTRTGSIEVRDDGTFSVRDAKDREFTVVSGKASGPGFLEALDVLDGFRWEVRA